MNEKPLFDINIRDHNVVCYTKNYITLRHPDNCDSQSQDCRNHIIDYLIKEGYMDECDSFVTLFDMYDK